LDLKILLPINSLVMAKYWQLIFNIRWQESDDPNYLNTR
jgi:hypothetical protein